MPATAPEASAEASIGDDVAVPKTPFEVLERELSDARSGPAARYAEVLERVLAVCESDPRATAYFDTLELHDELAEAYDQLGRVDDALRHADVLAAAHYKCAPDPRCRRAEILVRAGRLDEAAPIWDEVARDTPDDVWVYNNAGLEYGAVGDHETALPWLTRGLELAVRSGDPERLVGQLRELRAESLAAVGRETDDLQVAAPAAPPSIPGTTSPAAWRRFETLPMSWAWLPEAEFADVRTHWPDIAGSEFLQQDGLLIGHADYCRRFERRMRAARETSVAVIHIAPIRWSEFTRWVEQERPDSDDPSQLRAQFAADLCRDSSRVIAWPPGRNKPCWCGSGLKYKKCCAAPDPDTSR